MTPAQQFWWLAPTLSAIGIAVVAWLNWGRQALRAFRLKRPVNAFLTLAPEAGHDSWAHELHVPSNTEVPLQLRIEPQLTYKQQVLIFGFEGEASKRPQPLKVQNTFIKQGKRREESPAENENHFIDYNDAYHIREQLDRIKPNTYVYGFVVKTRAPGRYKIRLQIITDCGEGKPTSDLFLIVEAVRANQSTASTLPKT